MTKYPTLERPLDAHRAGWTWGRFWQEHGEAMRQAEPHNARRYRKLTDRLLSLLVSGDTIGHRPIGDDDAPWEVDDALDQQDQPVDDTATAARLLSPWAIEEPTP